MIPHWMNELPLSDYIILIQPKKIKNMLNKAIKNSTLLNINKAVQGETIEMKIERVVSNKEPISDGAPLIYTDRKDGVQPDYDIRTDRMDFAIDAMDKVSKTMIAQRKGLFNKKEETKGGFTEVKTPAAE